MRTLVRRTTRFAVLFLLVTSEGIVSAGEQHRIASAAVDGREVVLTPQPGQLTVVAFLGTECPLARLYAGRLQSLADEFADDQLVFVGVMSNRQDSIDDIVSYAQQNQIRFPLIHDRNNVIADSYQAARTPEVYLLSESLDVLYHGRVDDQYQPGVSRDVPTREDLRIAIQETLAGNAVSLARSEAPGCLIGRAVVSAPVVPTALTYADNIRPLLQQHCVECHRPGEIGPFSLSDYDEVVGWGETMLEVIDQKRMPPWHADPAVGHYRNERIMPESDVAVLREWVRGGMPRGSAEVQDIEVAASSGWQFPGDPDHIFDMSSRPFTVPSTGTVEYQYFVVDPGFQEDTWVVSAQVLPGNRSVVHHAIVFIRPPDGEEFRGVGWLTAYVPGQRSVTLPDGYARRVPAGSMFVFQMHYTPTGTEQSDLTRVGILTCNADDVTHEVFTVIGIDQEFEIPPGAPAHRVDGTVDSFPRDGTLLGIMPHMHFRGRSFEFRAELKNASERTLLRVPRYDFNWQHVYELDEAIPLHQVRSMSFTATFDNSAANPFNPDPHQTVSWGDQTWEEMAVVFCQVARPLHSADGGSPSAATAEAQSKQQAAQQRKLTEQFVDDFFRTLDENQDGVVTRSEAPTIVREFSFDRYDANDDFRITREEVRAVADRRYRSGQPD